MHDAEVGGETQLEGVLGEADSAGVIVPVHQHVVLVHGHGQVGVVALVVGHGDWHGGIVGHLLGLVWVHLEDGVP